MQIFGTDFDGVIINIEPQKAAIFGKIIENAWGMDKNEVIKYWMTTGGTSRRNKFNHFYHKKFGKELSDEQYFNIEKQFSLELKNNYYPKVELLPGALDLLKYVKNNFDFKFISSGVPMAEIQYLIELLKFSEYFDLVLGTNNLFRSKIDHFQKIVDENNPDLLVFVGDGVEDMRVAKQFQSKTIGVLTNCSKEDLITAGADITCATSLDIPPIIRTWLSQ
jgi:phosphoglycolate phosphatase